MRTLITIVLIISTVVRSQWLSVYSSTNVTDPEYCDSVDKKYAVLHYVEERTQKEGYLKLYTGIKLTDTVTFYIHGIIPKGCDFLVTAQVDTSTFDVLYTHVPIIADNQQGFEPDTVLTLKLPKYKYGGGPYQLAILRHWVDTAKNKRASREDLLIDGVFMEFPKVVLDTVRDTVIIDTVVASVKQIKKKFRIRRVEPYDIRGAHVDTLKAPWWIENDTATGLKRIRIRK